MNLIKLTLFVKVFRLAFRNINYFILSLLFIFTNVVITTASENNSIYYQNLSKDWRSIFPDGNRNAAGPKFYKHISDNYKSFEEFQQYNKHYCAVSGSLIGSGSTPQFVNLKEDMTEKNICGYYYKCCWPCVCDLMKYARVKKITKEFKEGSKDIYALIIDNPCAKEDFPKKVNKNYFCKENELDYEQVETQDGKLIIGILHEAKNCEPSDLRRISANKITGRFCPIRNRTPINELRSGMGDIFIKLAR